MLAALATTFWLVVAPPTPVAPAPLPYPFPTDAERSPCLWMGEWKCPEGFTPPDHP